MKKIPIIIDTDIGSDIDDTWALAMALGCPELDIKMIVTCTGDTLFRAKIVCKFLEKVGRTDIPVGIGLPFASILEHQRAYIKDYDLEGYPGAIYEDGIGAMANTIMSSEEKVTLVCIGPLPNIAKLLEKEPRVVDNTRFVGMHGAVHKGYNGSDEIHAEYNVIQHLATAKVVFSSDFDMTITPLDTCGIVRLEGDDYKKVAETGNATMSEVMENYQVWLTEMGADTNTTRSSILFDAVAIYLAFSETLLEIAEIKIAIDDDGKTVIDEDGKSIRVATDWQDLPAFYELLIERLLNAP